ncbi:MAG: hypothetical protein K0R14_368 [Burkholderiales bacterium]|jgi:hypothetical protein|nr:hypothetical protein [Burkholderiales bacterium]
MKNFINLIFIIILVFLTPICFANVEEEYAELKFAILDPINANFSESNSITRLVSLA